MWQTYLLEKFGFQEPFELGLLLLVEAAVEKSSLVDITLFISTAKLNPIKISLDICLERDVLTDWLLV